MCLLELDQMFILQRIRSKSNILNASLVVTAFVQTVSFTKQETFWMQQEALKEQKSITFEL
jgi:hypothetical protein